MQPEPSIRGKPTTDLMIVIRLNKRTFVRRIHFAAMMFALFLTGCGERTVTGGTPGSITIDGKAYPEIQVQFHQLNGNELSTLGFGVTDAEGKFRLLQNGASGKLYLQPGEYRVTVESIGPEVPIHFRYLDAETTPLRIKWTGKEKELSLQATTPEESNSEGS